MKHIYLLINPEKEVVAVYDDETLAKKMKKPIEEKLKTELTVEKRAVNLDLKVIGILR